MLTKYKQDNELTWQQLADEIGISRQSLDHIVKSRSPKITIENVIKIYNATGLSSHDYLNIK